MSSRLERVAWIASALLAVFAIAEFGNAARGQASTVPFFAPPQWPPQAADIVNLTGEFSIGSDGQTVDLFTVPTNRWLVVNEVRGLHLLSISMLHGVQLVEVDTAGAATVKVGAQFTHEYHPGAVNGSISPQLRSIVPGVAFQPGSRVQLRSVVPSGHNPSMSYRYFIAGYLSR